MSNRSPIFRLSIGETRTVTCFDTKGGYMGVAPVGVQSGDLIYILQISSSPVVLRKSGDQFEMISNAFVLGVMDGEVWPMVKQVNICVEEFIIH
jgi:hypothetical protein